VKIDKILTDSYTGADPAPCRGRYPFS
jgi:hypothetical protein